MADGVISKIQLPDSTIYDVVDNTSGYMTGMTILSYGSSTWQNFIDAYSSNKVVYCRASSNSNPASGSQTRLAFMAYVNNATTPTEVEFQYYRSVSSHTASQQGDQVFVYKLNKTNGWSVTTREASVKVVAGTGLGGTYSNGTMTLTGPTKVSDLTNDSGFITLNDIPTTHSIPSGGTMGQILAKNSATDYDVSWADASGGGGDIIKELTLTISGTTYTINKTYQELQDEYLNSFVVVNVVQGSYDYKAKGICIYDGLNDEFIVTLYEINSDDIGGLSLNYGVAINYDNQQHELFQHKYVPLETTVTDVEVNGVSVVEDGVAGVTVPTQASDVGAQPTLVSGTNIKTINNNSILGSGNLSIPVPTKTSELTNDSGFITSYTDTKNTAGSTNTSSKIYLIGATSQAANPQTYSHDTAYVGTDGYLYSNSKKTLVEQYSNNGYNLNIIPSVSSSSADFTIQAALDNSSNFYETLYFGSAGFYISNDIDEKTWIHIDNNGTTPVSIHGVKTPQEKYDVVNKKYVDDSINALDGSITGTAGAGKTLTAFSQTDGKVTATFGNISITKSQISDFPTIPTKVSDLTNDSGFVTTDEKVRVAALNSSNTYYPILASGVGTDIRQIATTGISFKDSGGGSTLSLGLDSYHWGVLKIGGESEYSVTVLNPDITANRTLTLPDKTGIVALTSDIPTKVSDLTNDSGYLTGITSSQVTTALGYTPYNSTNPNGYTSNAGTVTKVTAGTGLSIGTTAGGNFTTSGTINHTNSVTAQTTQAVYPIKIDAQGHISAYGNAVTIPTVNNATLTIQKNGTTVNTFTANASSNVTANITVPTITDTYSGTSSNGMSGKAVKSAIDALDGTITGSAGAGKTLTAFSQTNGKVSATFGDISITKSQISDFPTATKTTFTPLKGSSYSAYGGCYYKVYGSVVNVHLSVSGLTAGASVKLYTLPTDIHPSGYVGGIISSGSSSTYTNASIGPDGSVNVVPISGTYAIGDLTYII